MLTPSNTVISDRPNPMYVYPVVSKNGRVKPKIDGTFEKVVYAWYNMQNQKELVGVTGSLKRRLSAYSTAIHQANKENTGNDEFYHDIHNNPDDFEFRIYRVLDDSESLQEMEKHYINLLNSYKDGYNKNHGGGGGYPEPLRNCMSPEKAESSLDSFSPTTPVKRYPIVQGKNGKFQVKLSPGVKGIKRKDYPSGLCPHIYMISQKVNGVTKQVNIGRSEASPIKRIGKHVSLINTGKGSSLHEAIRKSPEGWEYGIVLSAEVLTTPTKRRRIISSHQAEKKMIEKRMSTNSLKEIPPILLNKSKGGEGGYAKVKLSL